VTTADHGAAPDYAAAYDAVRSRLMAASLTAQSTAAVPSCPGWDVHDVVAHLAGLCQDWVEQRFDGYASDPWTASQIARFAGWSMDDIFHAWSEAADAFTRVPDDTFLSSPPRWAFGDAVVHEADLRGATGLARVPTSAVLLSLRGAIARWRDVVQAADGPSLVIRSREGHEWRLGHRDARPDDDGAVVETSLYELFRALAGRRSAAHVRDWDWSRDPKPFLDIGLPYPFRWASSHIGD
jgi:uncharacterized protein (TIGR03083 family)